MFSRFVCSISSMPRELFRSESLIWGMESSFGNDYVSFDISCTFKCMLLSDLLHRQKTPKVTGITSLILFFHFFLTVILCTVSLSLSLKSDNNNTYRLIPQIIFSNSIHSHLFFNEKLHQLLVKNENVLIIALFLIDSNENISSNFHLRHTCLLMSWLHTKLNFLNLYCNWRLR